MNQTKKEIIGLIEPYMDKTLSYGCYCKDNGHYIRLSYIEDDNRISFHFTDNSGGGLVSKTSIDKILGHYDITAVLKYIINHNCFYNDNGLITEIIIFQSLGNFEDKRLINIPNKPLHLYSEKEEKNLIKLLKTIG